jgi:drug/metabolite transporter (DMT)-like permease
VTKLVVDGGSESKRVGQKGEDGLQQTVAFEHRFFFRLLGGRRIEAGFLGEAWTGALRCFRRHDNAEGKRKVCCLATLACLARSSRWNFFRSPAKSQTWVNRRRKKKQEIAAKNHTKQPTQMPTTTTSTNNNDDDDDDDDDDDIGKKNDDEKASAMPPAAVPTERDPLLLSSAGGPPLPPPRRVAVPPRRPGATSATPAPPHGGLASRPPPVIDARRRAATTSTVDTVHQSPLRPSLTRQHFRNRSSLRQIMTEDIMPGLRSESELVRGMWRQSLADAVAGRTYFFDMGMTRSLSVLPDDMTNLVEETVLSQIPHKPKMAAATATTLLEQEQEEVEDSEPGGPVRPKQQHPKKATRTGESSMVVQQQYASLLLAVIAVSSNGTALTLLHGVPPALKLYWRMTVTGLCLLGLALPRLLSSSSSHNDGGGGWPTEMTAWPKLLSLVCAAACFAGQGLCFVNALQYTSIGNVVIGANSQAILLVVGKLVSGETVHWLEGGGVVLAFVGFLMCAQDEARERGGAVLVDDPEVVTTPPSSFWERSVGELLAFCAGLFGVFYLILAKSIRPYMPVSLFVACVMLLGSIIVIPFCYLSSTTTTTSNVVVVTWTTDPNVGFFGWVSGDRIFVMAHIVLVCNLLGTVGFVRAMQYFDNLIIAVATLLEPLIATIIAFILGVGLLPGPLGWLGNLVVLIGTLGVVIPSINNNNKKEGGGASSSAH